MTKNATIDEPLHALSGWIAMRNADFRLVPESPSLWQCWAALPNIGVNLSTHFYGKEWSDNSFDSQGGVNWTNEILYKTPGNDGEAFIKRSRAMMMVPGLLLGGVIGWWSFQLAGSVASITALLLFCLDPNFLAHTPIVKSDVPMSLAMCGFGYAVWRWGQRASVLRLIGICLLIAIAVNTKFSGLLLLPILGLLLCIRVALPEPLEIDGHLIKTFCGRFFVAVFFCIVAVLMCVGVTWASYGFRFRPAPSVVSQMDMAGIRERAIVLETGASTTTPKPTPLQIAEHKPSLIVRGVDFANAHHLLPQAMLGGLLYQHACLQVWPLYVLGRLYGIGQWFYYPLAILFKTPLATLVAIVVSLAVAGPLIFKCRDNLSITSVIWSAACLFIPFAVFAVSALQSNLNIGLRSVLPLYPFLYVGCGVAAAQAMRFWPPHTRLVMVLLAIGLALETLPAWPDFIPFFNVAAGGKSGGFRLLGDSNLDWGQDLKPLVAWHEEHREIPIYLHYFGMADPEFFNHEIHHFSILDKGKTFNANVPLKPGVLAVSTNYLQGLYDNPDDIDFFRKLGQRHPDKIIGGSIYLYKYPLR